MKKVSKKLTNLIKGTLAVSLLVGLSLSVSAQDKPKGTPWAAPAADMKIKNPVKSDESTLKAGKDLYATHCKSCHGVKGQGDGAKAEKIDISCGDFSGPEFAKVSDGEVFWKTTEGRKPMPSFKEKLSDNERWTVVTYLRSLGK